MAVFSRPRDDCVGFFWNAKNKFNSYIKELKRSSRRNCCRLRQKFLYSQYPLYALRIFHLALKMYKFLFARVLLTVRKSAGREESAKIKENSLRAFARTLTPQTRFPKTISHAGRNKVRDIAGATEPI